MHLYAPPIALDVLSAAPPAGVSEILKRPVQSRDLAATLARLLRVSPVTPAA